MKKLLIFLIFGLFVVILPRIFASPAGIYVATNGSDTTGAGTIDKPFKTINKAQNYVAPGTTVYVRGGTYKAATNITKGSGTSSSYVTYSAYPGETVVIDGTGLNLGSSDSLLSLYGVNYVKVNGFEVANSSGRGMSASNANYVTIQNNKVHDIRYRGIGGTGSNITIDSNEVYNTALVNAGGSMGAGGWPAAINSYMKPDGSASQNFIITNNHVYNSWGEGIIALNLDGGVVRGNRVHDTYSVLIYGGNSKNVIIDGNYLYATNATYFRDGKPATGILIAAEDCCKTNPAVLLENFTISNNLIVKTRFGVRYWIGDYGIAYKNMKVYFNTIKDPTEAGVSFDSTTTSGNEMKNNIIYGSALMPNASSWTFSNNNWPSGKPSVDTSSTSFSADPLFVSPQVAGSVDGYKLQSSSSSIGKGTSVPVIKDYFGSTRNTNPTVGFFEGSSSTSSLLCPPTGQTAGGVALMTFNLAATGNYKIWLNLMGHGDAANTVWVQLDDLYCVKAGDIAGMPQNVWTWVDSTIPNPLLSAGSHTIRVIGNPNEPGVGFDRMIVTKDLSCVPTGDGGACIGVTVMPTPTQTPVPTPTPVPAANDTTYPQVAFTSPSDGATVGSKGVVSVSATASDASGISSMHIYVDSSLEDTCTGVSTCTTKVNVGKLSSGSHALVAEAYDNSTNKNKNVTSIIINVQ